MSFRTPICDLFEIEHPIFLAGMGQVAYAEVCAAVSEAGGYGTLGMAAEPPERIREEMRKVRRLTDKPFGVDLLEHARRSEEAGCDAVVAQGTEAGGHTGRVAGMALVPQVVDAVRIPVLAAGSIVDGRGLAAALALGAQGVWVGTRFIASEEARAAAAFKQRIVGAGGADTLVTRCYSGKPMRVITNSYAEDYERHPERIQAFPEQMVVSARAGVLGYASDTTTDVEKTCMPAGQGIGGIHEVLPASEIITRMLSEARANIRRLSQLV
jgi:enoyl-[acyl-carrier protein] reductase II